MVVSMFFFFFALVSSVSDKTLNISKPVQAVIPAVCMIGLVLIGIVLYFIFGRSLDSDEIPAEADEEEDTDEVETSRDGEGEDQAIAEL